MNILTAIIDYFLWFMLYSVLGWIMETLLFAIRDKKSVKRGFLFGPLCPIYGTGAVLCTLVLYGRITNFFALFGAGLVLCTVIEYITGTVLENVFHSKWWDYSNQKLNFKGRICVTSSLLFGGGVAVLLKFVQPFVIDVTAKIPFSAKAIVAFIIYSILIVDVAITVQSLKDFIAKLKEIQQFLINDVQEGIDKTDEKVDELVEHIKSIPSPEAKFEQFTNKIKSNEHIENLVNNMKNNDRQTNRIKNLMPKFEIKKYKETIDLIFNRSSDNDEHTDENHDNEDTDKKEK